MDLWSRHQKIWGVLQVLTRPWLPRKFGLESVQVEAEGPMLLVSNHVCAWDPLLVAMSLRHKQVYYVASEHIFRLGLASRLLNALVAPIPRRKAGSGADTVKAILRHLKAGHSVCLFAEGEQCWTGVNPPIFPATGKLARTSGASLVTFRIEGGYLSLPRWSLHGVRRGRVRAHPVKVYSPEELKAMTPAEINAAITADIREDAWERQRRERIAYRGRRMAEGLVRALYLCPSCKRFGTLRTENDRVQCDCGFETRWTETGFFDPPAPFADLEQWDRWQREALGRGDYVRPADPAAPLFSDGSFHLSRLGTDHEAVRLGEGPLLQYADRLVCAGREFPWAEITNMALVQSHLLLLTDRQGDYYECRAMKPANLRKYLELWKQRT